MVRLENLLDAKVQALFHDTQPANCPTDLLAKQSFLRAHAVLALLLDGNGSRLGRPVIDWGVPVDLPDRVLADLYRVAKVCTVVVRNGVIIDAPGELNLGRSTRVANRAQRRALGALYATCSIPGCDVRYSRAKLHHVIWWRHDGRTDLDNLTNSYCMLSARPGFGGVCVDGPSHRFSYWALAIGGLALMAPGGAALVG